MKKSIQPVQFHFLIKPFTLLHRTDLKRFLERICRLEKKKLESLVLVFCSDKYLLDLNKRFLKHDYFTDILSFTLSKPGKPIQGEIYISIDRVKENAKSYGEPFTRELHRVIFHGTLHFCGYKDKTTSLKKKMRLKEDQYLKIYGLGVPRDTVS